MQDTRYKVLIWLPSPMGDAVLCTPALRAIRSHLRSAEIWLFGNRVVREVLDGCGFEDGWLVQGQESPLATARELRRHRFRHVVLLKNSFGSALASFLAGIKVRIGYGRQWRRALLTERLLAPRLSGGKFEPRSMVDYYLAIAARLGADSTDRRLELGVGAQQEKSLREKLPEVWTASGPVVIFVPGGAFGASKCWPSVSFARTAEGLIEKYNATVVVSVAPSQLERQIADEICELSGRKLINLARQPVNLGELKALFSRADLVITNDTGPRHIAIALGRNVVSLFGPNDPVWTDTGYENEIQIVGNVPCAPCARPRCRKAGHPCMQAITVETVYEAASELLEGDRRRAVVKACAELVESAESFWVDPEYQDGLAEAGLRSVEDVFGFDSARELVKDNLARFRSRLQFRIERPATELFLKRYDRPPAWAQLRNRLSRRKRKSFGVGEYEAAAELAAAGINTPKVVCCGEQRGVLFEKRSFIITERIGRAESLEQKLPACFEEATGPESLKCRRDFIARLASFVRRFHDTGYRHRDLYLCHIFHGEDGTLHLIDLARAFRPRLLGERYRVKDIAQLYYSAPGRHFSRTDRLRFYLCYTGRLKPTSKDKAFIARVTGKAARMARHDVRHGRSVPLAS
jgi:heptosyltransferase-2